MMALAEKIYDEALDLPTDERLSLLNRLERVGTATSTTKIEAAWLEESHERLSEIRSGQTKTLSGESVFQEIKERFQR